jgi:hypothetical protein
MREYGKRRRAEQMRAGSAKVPRVQPVHAEIGCDIKPAPGICD